MIKLLAINQAFWKTQ